MLRKVMAQIFGAPRRVGVAVHGFQIVYDEVTRSSVDPEFEELNNFASLRPDWYEYWPIRGFFDSNDLDEGAYYGFLSPKFAFKTGLTGRDVLAFIGENYSADVVLFSPFPDHGAAFLSVFEQACVFDPLALDVAVEFFKEATPDFDVLKMVNHSGNSVFCNFIFAKPAFWREWLSLCGRLFDAAERGTLSGRLCEFLPYTDAHGISKPVQRKVFLMERLASCILSRSSKYQVASYPIEKMHMPPSSRLVAGDLHNMDILKRAFVDSGDLGSLERFCVMQADVVWRVVSPGSPFAFQGIGSSVYSFGSQVSGVDHHAKLRL